MTNLNSEHVKELHKTLLLMHTKHCALHFENSVPLNPFELIMYWYWWYNYDLNLQY